MFMCKLILSPKSYCIHNTHLQLEQEVKLCLRCDEQSDDIKATFLVEWGKFVPAILLYAESSKKRPC